VKKSGWIVLGALFVSTAASAQQLPGVVGHPERELVNADPSKSAAGHYVTDRNHTAVIGRILHGNLAYLYFRFDPSGIEGSFDYAPDNPEASVVEVTLDSSTIDFGLPNFDRRVLSPEFVDAERYPDIKFVSTEITRNDMDHGTMTGDLTLHGVTRPITFDVTFNGGGPSGRRVKMGFSATAELTLAGYDIDVSESNVTDHISLNIETEFINEGAEIDLEAIQALQAQP
jgi:polyisoprenoid-binding protein YceI